MDDDSPRTMQTLDIYGLHGLARTLVDSYAAMAAVCLERHHNSPKPWSVQIDGAPAREYEVSWHVPTNEERLSFDNDDETTEFGACSLALAAAEAHLGLVAYARARPRTCVDVYLLRARADVATIVSYDYDHSASVGLEVSGINEDTNAKMNDRLREKVEQVRRGDSPDHAIVGVVGFRTARVAFRTAKP